MDSLSNYPRPYIAKDNKKAASKRPSSTGSGKSKRHNIKIKPLYIVLVLLIGVSVFFFIQYQDAKNKLNPSATIAKTDNQILANLGKIYLLPKNQTPLFRTVNDASKLTSQTYFANAANGDKLIVYAKEHLAILFRPSTDQVINVGSASVGSSSASSTSK